MKKLGTLVLAAIFMIAAFDASSAPKAKSPKYIFYFIGDGMGLAPVYNAELLLAATGSNDTMLFNKFPSIGFAYTYSTDSKVTDSAAAGTALATGFKTSNGTIGMKDNHKDTLESVAYRAKKMGKAVGIITSVSIDHATPAAFYGHQPKRSMAYEIAMDGLHTGFDLYAGSGFLEPISKKNSNAKEVYSAYKDAGYNILRGKGQLSELASSPSKVLLVEREGVDNESFAYAIDRTGDDLALDAVVGESIKFLEKRAPSKGFFMMAEGGKIDWANHANDIGGSVGEVIDFNKAIQKAYEFYLAHPNETLIIVTSDHETGGQSVGNEKDPDMEMVASQKVSQWKLETIIADSKKNGKPWEELKAILAKETGLFGAISVSLEDEFAIRSAYQSASKKVAAIAIKAVSNSSGIGWTTTGHTGHPVMIYSVGAGAENFSGKMENTDIPNTIARIMK